MLNFGNKEFRNLQEQVEKNKEDISQLKTGIKIEKVLMSISELSQFLTEENVGKYYYIADIKKLYVISKRANDGLIAENLGDYPAGTEGPQGEVGPEGPQGPTGNSVYGVSTQLPDPAGYKTGDFYLLANGNLYKKSLELQWVLQCSIRGPQGPVGTPGAEVYANPVSEATESLLKIKIDGVTYRITAPTEEEKVLLGKLVQTIEIEEGGGTVTFGNNIYVDGNISTPSYLEANHLTVEDSSSIGGDLLVTGDVSANLLEAETTETDLITSDTTTSASQHVQFAYFNSNDNFWHVTNTKVDDTMYIEGTIELGTVGDIGDNFYTLIENIADDRIDTKVISAINGSY